MRVVFHHPLPIYKSASSASGIRPLKMLSAFKALGCEVELVIGYSAERKICMENVKANIRRGVKYDFVYSESSTMPTPLTDPHHFPLHPLADWLFFRSCKRHGIPIGLFYRDIYWVFGNYGTGLNPIKAAIAKAAYRFDLWVYDQTITKLYLPSLEMGRYIPTIDPTVFKALPPGHVSPEVKGMILPDLQTRPLKLFYVGGMSNHYELHKLFIAISDLPQVELTVCTREEEWHAVEDDYPTLTANIRVIHKVGDAMERELQSADIAVLFVKPKEYREFASPVKLYEYLGFRKPILASEGTLAGAFVRDNGIGWTIPYEETAVRKLLASVADDPSVLSEIHLMLEALEGCHSWEARAQQVIKDLTQ